MGMGRERSHGRVRSSSQVVRCPEASTVVQPKRPWLPNQRAMSWAGTWKKTTAPKTASRDESHDETAGRGGSRQGAGACGQGELRKETAAEHQQPRDGRVTRGEDEDLVEVGERQHDAGQREAALRDKQSHDDRAGAEVRFLHAIRASHRASVPLEGLEMPSRRASVVECVAGRSGVLV